jgi:LPS sulfotransferase NodH
MCDELRKLYRNQDCMKHLWFHVPDRVNCCLIDWLGHQECRVIHVQRRDRLRQAISLYLAQSTGVWGISDLRDSERYLDACRSIRIDVGRLRASMAKMANQEADYTARLSEGALLTVSYEQLFGESSVQHKTVRKILKFTGIPSDATDLEFAMHRRLHSGLRQTTDKVYAQIPNIIEIEKAFFNSLIT